MKTSLQQRAGPGSPAAFTAQLLQAAFAGHTGLQGTPHSVFPKGRRTRDFLCWSFPGLQDSQSVCKTFSACLLLCSSLEPCDICFSSPSESLCGCHQARFQHFTTSNVQLHLDPCWLQGGNRAKLILTLLDSTSLHLLSQSQKSQLHPPEAFLLLVPLF